MSATSRVRSPVRAVAWLLAAVLLLVVGCAAEPEGGPLWADPGVVRLSPDRTRATIEIHNRSGTPRPISGIALRGPDWDSLRFVDETHPRTVPAEGSVLIPLEVSAASFQIEPGRYDSGSATLIFASNKHEYELPIEFDGSTTPSTSPSPIGLLALLGLAALVAWSPLRSRRLPATTSYRTLAAATMAALLVAAAGIPIGFGVCRGRLSELVGPRESATCRELIEVSAAPAIWWWVASLSIAAATLVLLRAHTRRSSSAAGGELALAGLRSLGMVLILAALLLGFSPTEDSAAALISMQAEMTELAGVSVPRWGLVAQPLGACLAFALVACCCPITPSAEPGAAALERLESLVWSAVLVTAFLGGPSIPYSSQRPIPLLAHRSTIALELVMLALELALVTMLVGRLRAKLAASAIDLPRLVAIHSRVTIPLALLQLVLVLLWRAA